jgi:hypothetical protein
MEFFGGRKNKSNKHTIQASRPMIPVPNSGRHLYNPIPGTIEIPVVSFYIIR